MTMPSFPRPLSRRQLLKSASSGFGYLAFAALAHDKALAESPVKSDPLAPKKPHFPARAKRVIFLSMRGAPSHVDTFDYKPQLTKDHGKAGQYGSTRGDMLLGSPWEFKQHGQSGLHISELFPGVASHADDLCLLRSMQTDQPNHPQATLQMNTGSFQFVRPSLGAWSLYGLGTENANLPGFITLNPRGSAQNYGSSFLPAIYQGSKIDAGGGRRRRGGDGTPKIPNIENNDMTREEQRFWLDYVQSLNRTALDKRVHQPGIDGVIESFEMAFRMQDSLPEQIDLTGETEETKELYGIGNNTTDTFGKQCLLARRLAESGVRFIEVNHASSWDQHRNLKNDMEKNCSEIDTPIAGLLTDLKRRNLLDNTLVIWAGEFGRTPHGQGNDGRDHNNKGYSTWMAGGGVKGGYSYGATDEHGYEAVEDKMHIHDWHATILHLMGIDHEKLTYNYAGRDFRLTDVKGFVAEDIVA